MASGLVRTMLRRWLQRQIPAGLVSVEADRGWVPIIREPMTGAWQTGEIETPTTALTNSTVFACVTLIASDIAKCRIKLEQLSDGGIWTEISSAAFSPVLRRPNHYQNRIQFFTTWIVSKLLWGNTYVLKARDARGLVVRLYVLDPQRVRVLVAPDGSVFYQLQRDNLSGLEEGSIVVPAREMIHDVMVPLFHPLVGVTPIYACGLAALQGLQIQYKSAKFFGAGSQPGGVLTAPGTIATDTAKRIKDYWDENFSGDNIGKVAVLGDGLKYEAMAVKATDAQLIEQLKWTGADICSAYHVPAYKVGVGPEPNYNNITALNQQYYSQCLQAFFEALELLLDEGLELPAVYGTEFEIENLLRMDSATQMEVAKNGVGGGILTPNEARATFNRKPQAGGDSVYLQQQYYSLEALARREAPPAGGSATVQPASGGEARDADERELLDEQALLARWRAGWRSRGLAQLAHPDE